FPRSRRNSPPGPGALCIQRLCIQGAPFRARRAETAHCIPCPPCKTVYSATRPFRRPRWRAALYTVILPLPPHVVLALAPGRVNLIGEHTDYNGGFVLPTATPHRTRVRLPPSASTSVSVRTANLDQTSHYALGEEQPGKGWLDYPQGVTWALRQAGYTL